MKENEKKNQGRTGFERRLDLAVGRPALQVAVERHQKEQIAREGLQLAERVARRHRVDDGGHREGAGRVVGAGRRRAERPVPKVEAVDGRLLRVDGCVTVEQLPRQTHGRRVQRLRLFQTHPRRVR